MGGIYRKEHSQLRLMEQSVVGEWFQIKFFSDGAVAVNVDRGPYGRGVYGRGA